MEKKVNVFFDPVFPNSANEMSVTSILIKCWFIWAVL